MIGARGETSVRANAEAVIDNAATPDDPHGYLASRSHEAAMEGLHRALQDRTQLVVLTGEAGSGRTTLMLRLAAEINGDTKTILCRGNGLDFSQILSFVCAELGVAVTNPTRTAEIGALAGFLSQVSSRRVVLLVDDADRLAGDALEHLLRLIGLLKRESASLALVLGGEPGLQTRLKRERATHPCVGGAMFVRITRLALGEATAMVERVAAGNRQRHAVEMTDQAIARVVERSQGNPARLIGLCDAAVARAFSEGRDSVSGEVVDRIRIGDPDSVSRTPEQGSQAPHASWPAAPGLSAAGATGSPDARAVSGGTRKRVLLRILALVAVVAVVAVATLRFQARVTDNPAPLAATPDSQAAPQPATQGISDVLGTKPGAGSPLLPVETLPMPADIRPTALAEGPMPDQATIAAPLAPTSAPSPVPEPAAAVQAPAQALQERESINQRHLADLHRARAALARNALTTPNSDNAVKWAESVLAVAPGNEDAKAVLGEVVERYLGWSNRSLGSNDLGSATRYLARARSVSRHAAQDQLAAMEVLDEAIATRQRSITRIASKSRTRKQHAIPAPKWLLDLEQWVEGLPLPVQHR